MSSVKQAVRALLPSSLLLPLQRYRYRNVQAQYRGLSGKEIFTKIYQEGAWGQSDDPAQQMYSGTGSHARGLVAPYIDALRRTLASFPAKPNVVDLGCGNFHIGSQIRHLCGAYIACDIVEPVIEANRRTYKDLNVDFRVLDITQDELPGGDVVFVRQVLQHLSNKDIAGALSQIASKYRYLILTEHLPKSDLFAPNIDKATGPDIRLGFNSGVIVTSPPFNLKAQDATCLCEVEENGGIIRTVLYRLA